MRGKRILLPLVVPLLLGSGPSRGDVVSPHPGLDVTRTRVVGGIFEVVLSGDAGILRGRDLEREDLVRDLLWQARRERPEVTGIQVYLQMPGAEPVLLSELLRDPAEEARARSLRGLPGPRIPGLPPGDLPYGGSLTGKSIALSPGHGWTYNSTARAWGFQRGLVNLPGCASCLGIVEDLSNAEIASRYLIPHLLRAGATVWSVRERDLSEDEIIVDEDAPGVLEEGAWSYGNSPGGYADDYRVMLASEGGRVAFPLVPSAEGLYWVSVWYVEGSNRVTDAVFAISHQGGLAEHHLNQQANGSRWIHLGAYRFATSGGQLEIRPGPGAQADAYLIADAVRLGGGFDTQSVDSVPANKPRWMMDALRTLPYFGLPAAVNTGGDVTIRPAFAEWQGADAFLSLHSNASGGSTSSATGSSTYRFNCYTYPDHSAAPDPSLCDDPPGSDALQRAIQSSLVHVLREHWDPEWRDRGALVANFGEVRVLDSIPGALVESAFHDGTVAATGMRMPDNEALQDPRFRYWLGYALYSGLTEFLDPDAVLLPAHRPEGLHLVHAPGGGMLVAWEPVEGALGYRVRWAAGHRGLQEGLVASETSVILDEMDPGQVVAVEVSALNAGGEGPPSELAAARYRGHGTYADVLLVSGFDRLDARIGEDRNRRDQAWAHALAVATIPDRNLYFDFASNESLEAGRVPLEAYRALVWILGEESTEDETFGPAEQASLAGYLDAGGAVMASGAEIGWDLVDEGTADDITFFGDTFGAVYLEDDAGTVGVSGAGRFSALGDLVFDEGSHGIYPVEYPDVFDAAGGETVLIYDSGDGAGVAYERDPGRSLLLGFPFETIVEPDARMRLMDLALGFLLPGHTPDDFDGDGLPDAWEHANHTDPLNPSAGDDPDGDGKTNLEEFQDGTDPQVPDHGADGGRADGGTEPGSGGGCGCSQADHRARIILLLALFVVPRRRRTHR